MRIVTWTTTAVRQEQIKKGLHTRLLSEITSTSLLAEDYQQNIISIGLLAQVY